MIKLDALPKLGVEVRKLSLETLAEFLPHNEAQKAFERICEELGRHSADIETARLQFSCRSDLWNSLQIIVSARTGNGRRAAMVIHQPERSVAVKPQALEEVVGHWGADVYWANLD